MCQREQSPWHEHGVVDVSPIMIFVVIQRGLHVCGGKADFRGLSSRKGE